MRETHPELAAALGKVIYGRRKELRKSQEDLAYESDMSVRQLQKLETGEAVNAMIGNVYAIGMALDLDFAELAARVQRAMKSSPKTRRR